MASSSGVAHKRVRFAPIDSDLQSANSTTVRSSSRKGCNVTLLPRLVLGDTCTSPQEMLIESNRACALEKVNSLQKHDFAFVLRKDGRWTFAIIADRDEDSIRFVVDFRGSTKTLSRNRWSSRIRLVNNQRNRDCVLGIVDRYGDEAGGPSREVPSRSNDAST